MSDLKTEFWKRIGDVRSCMLGVADHGPLVAMSPQLDDDYPGKLWFITAKGTNIARAVAGGPQTARLVVSDDKQGLYADVVGELEHSTDREALDEVWSFVADAWFEGGQHDPDVSLLSFVPKRADMSITTGGVVRFLYEIAKGNLTGKTPDMGENGRVEF